jgi:hypothetical protein
VPDSVGDKATGLAIGAKGLTAERLELLKEAFPGVWRVGYLANMANPTASLNPRELQDAAQLIGVEVQTLDVRGPYDLTRPSMREPERIQMDGLIVLEDPLTLAHRARIVEFTEANGLLANYERREWVEAGGRVAHTVTRTMAGQGLQAVRGWLPHVDDAAYCWPSINLVLSCRCGDTRWRSRRRSGSREYWTTSRSPASPGQRER